jgi:predicted lipoprotein
MKWLLVLAVLLVVGCGRAPSPAQTDAYTQALLRYRMERETYADLADRVRETNRNHQELIRLCQQSPGPSDEQRIKASSDFLDAVRREAERQWLRMHYAGELRNAAWDGDSLPPQLQKTTPASESRAVVESIK